jgi:DUF4097 and DUF4098 domain-containing protein YvlB
MTKIVTKNVITVGFLLMLMLTIPVHASSVNKSVKIAAGSESDGASSVNGSVTVGEGAVVTGDVETVNGTIRIDENATIRDAETVNGALRVSSGVKAEDLSTVNGAIRIDENVTVNGHVEAVNGSIGVAKGSKVSRDVSNVNGEIELAGSEIGGDLSTINGDIKLRDGAVVKGDLLVEKPGGVNWGNRKTRKPEIVIGPGSQVQGTIRLEREVKLFISESAKVGGVTGTMTMDDAIRFAGEHP